MNSSATEEFLVPLLQEAADIARKFSKEGFKSSLKQHSRDVVTEADHAVSDFLIERISVAYPDHAILSEERPEKINAGAEYEWVLDPIDGTYEFSHGMPSWCILTALLRNDEPVFAGIVAPVAGDLITAAKGEGAHRNGRRMRAADTTSFDRALFGIQTDINCQDGKLFVDVAAKILHKGCWPISHLSMMTACYVATGAVDVDIINGGKDWDHLAPALVCREAGAKVTDRYGADWRRGVPELVITCPGLHDAVIETIAECISASK